MAQSTEHIGRNDSHRAYHFAPAFELPVSEGDNAARYSHPETMRSYTEVTPIQLAVHIPLTRFYTPKNEEEKKAVEGKQVAIRFRVKGHHITTEITYPQFNDREKEFGERTLQTVEKMDWHELLSENERVEAMRYIMAEFRHRSLGNEGFRVAAIGLTRDHELFIASNTRPRHQLYKKCAETGVIAAALEHSEKTNMNTGKQLELLEDSTTPIMFEDFFVMGGKDNSDINIACPCGSCTDELHDHMANKEGSDARQKPGYIYILPSEKNLPTNTSDLKVLQVLQKNETAQNLHELDDNQYWKVTPEKLYGRHSFKANAALKKHQEKTLAQRLKGETSASSSLDAVHEKIADFLQSIEKEALSDKPSPIISDALLAGTLAFGAAIDGMDEGQKSAAWKANAQQQLAAKPILALEASAANHEGGNNLPSPEALNQFMTQEIDHVLESRLAEYSHTINMKNIGEHIDSIRCVVMQLADGQFVHGTEANTTLDSSMPNAELNALTKRLDQISRTENPVKHVWEMALNPAAIKDSKIPTMSRDGAERIGKRVQDLKEMDVTFLPYNNGSLQGSELQKHTHKVPFSKIYPGMFAGRNGSGVRPSAYNMHDEANASR